LAIEHQELIMKYRSLLRVCLFLVAVVFLAAGCKSVFKPFRSTLRVGVTPDYPPIIMKEDGILRGLEIDFAVRLADELGRPIDLVELPWDRQVSALLGGKIDLIMSGMTATDLRRVRIDFCDPYMKSGQMALVRRKDISKIKTREDVLYKFDRIGVKKGTTADGFVQENCPHAQVIQYLVPNDAALAVRNRRLDVLIYDAPAIWWLASQYEADLAVVPILLTTEDIAWGIKPGNDLLKQQINAVLATWKQDGTLQTLLNRWVPTLTAE
jgi:ABC-type amino acid transport substrate-binding protein